MALAGGEQHFLDLGDAGTDAIAAMIARTITAAIARLPEPIDAIREPADSGSGIAASFSSLTV